MVRLELELYDPTGQMRNFSDPVETKCYDAAAGLFNLAVRDFIKVLISKIESIQRAQRPCGVDTRDISFIIFFVPVFSSLHYIKKKISIISFTTNHMPDDVK